MSNEQELTKYNTGINAYSGGAYMSVYDNEEEKAETIEYQRTDKGDNIQQTTERSFCIRLIIAYIRPITLDIGHSLCCIFYNVYNFFFALGIFIFDVTTVTTSLALTTIFCIGLGLLWLSYECMLLLSRFDLAMAYYLVERDVKSMGKRRQLLKLSVYMRGLPICCENTCCCCADGCISIITRRAKHLFYSGNMFCILIYHIFIRWIITIFSSITVILCGYLVGIVSTPIWYAIDNSFFDDKNICPFGAKTKCENWKQCDCNVLTIDNIWTSVGFAIGALLLLPIAFIISNTAANMVKKCTYYFYTYYYSNDLSLIEDKQSLLNQKQMADIEEEEIDEEFI